MCRRPRPITIPGRITPGRSPTAGPVVSITSRARITGRRIAR